MSDNPTFILGSKYTKPKSTELFSFTDNLAGGLAPGHKACVRKKMDGNEDAMAYVPTGSDQLLLLADAHFGASAGEMAVTGFPEVFQETEGPMDLRLLTGHMAVDRKIRAHRLRDPKNISSSTFISVHVSGDRVHYCSTGDSHVYLLHAKGLRKMNESHPSLFVGDGHGHLQQINEHLREYDCMDAVTEPNQIARVIYELTQFKERVQLMEADQSDALALLNKLEGLTGLKPKIQPDDLLETWFDLYLLMSNITPDFGSFSVHEGDVMLLASDGLDEVESACSQEDLEEAMRQGRDARDIAARIIKRCTTRRGNNDNLMIMTRCF